MKKENQELINKFKFIKEKFESSLKVNQEILDSKEAENTSIRCDISVWKEKYEKECIDHKEARDKILKSEDKVGAAISQIKNLESEKKSLKKNNDDLKDELNDRNKKLEGLETENVLKTSARSLSDELGELQSLKCNHCDKIFLLEANLKDHEAMSHTLNSSDLKDNLLKKISHLENRTFGQKTAISSALFKLKDKELTEKLSCKSYCNKFCRVDHNKYKFVKSQSEELFCRLSGLSENQVSSHVSISGFGVKVKCYTCSFCEENFKKQGDLKRHTKYEHRRERKAGEV